MRTQTLTFDEIATAVETAAHATQLAAEYLNRQPPGTPEWNDAWDEWVEADTNERLLRRRLVKARWA